ncbi:glucosaminidase domain and LysM peptidoglycan-binding domain-containing protein [Pedobacter montanisoli]|uniref:Peptidoglycan hydrolase n=1 Tax=Pedobacter montanisoli TaxID=2923277 RepID=A0ABS9ZTY9_9SPHI|nr:glucosaminidase domain-containing protein [Pedobacter montanisoli]MCJ0741697.1 glucosaminidase domain-containing protein [Pedobacter montanisoli]
MKKITFLVLALLIFNLVKAQSVTEDYILENAPKAQELMRMHLVPASVILGIAIHESGAGTSKVARYLNNHFGFKGKNSSTEIRSSYRDFPTVDSSYNHFIVFLKSRAHYNSLFDKYDQYDFKSWVKGIQRGGYAGSRKWGSQVMAIINKYQLWSYDERPDGYEEPIVEAEPVKSVKKISLKTYTVKSGDNLSIIAKKYKTSVKSIMTKNNLKSNALKPGQKLKL